MIKQKTAKFLRIVCPRCKSPKIIYGKSTIKIKCQKCNYLLIRTTGGKTRVKAPIRQIIE